MDTATTTPENEPRTVTVAIEIADTPSHSKGWGKFRVLLEGRSVLATRSGTEWGSGRVRDIRRTEPLAPGSELEVEMVVLLTEGRARRKVTTTITRRIRVNPGASCELTHKPGSQGMTLAISGAEVL